MYFMLTKRKSAPRCPRTFKEINIESYVHSNPESPTRPMYPHVPVSNGIPSTLFVGSFSQIYPEDPPSTKSVKSQLFMYTLASLH